MIKVLLITSREFKTFDKNFETNFQELDSYQDVFVDDSEDNPTRVMEKDKYLGLFFDKIWGLDESVLAGKKTVADKTTAVRDGIDNKKIPRKENLGCFTFGIWKKQLSNSEYIYLADEFPPIKSDTDQKFKYLNALIDEIKNDLGSSQPITWTIVSHDKDWDVDARSKIIKESGESKPSSEIKDYENYSRLKEILENQETFIAVFQHDGFSEWYGYVKQHVFKESND